MYKLDDLDHEIMLISWKKNIETQFLIHPLMRNEIEKNQLKKIKKPKSTCQIRILKQW